MRHGHGLRKLNRTSSHRLAMLRNMANSLIEHEAIKTTVPKAKELRRVVEPLITLAKEPTVANKRLAFDRLRNRDNVVKLFNVLGPRFAKRPGGYTAPSRWRRWRLCGAVAGWGPRRWPQVLSWWSVPWCPLWRRMHPCLLMCWRLPGPASSWSPRRLIPLWVLRLWCLWPVPWLRPTHWRQPRVACPR